MQANCSSSILSLSFVFQMQWAFFQQMYCAPVPHPLVPFFASHIIFPSPLFTSLLDREIKEADDCRLRLPRHSYDPDALRQAVVKLRAQRDSTSPLSIRTVASLFGVPKTTLALHASATRLVRIGRPPRLSSQDEEELWMWLVHRADMNQPVELRSLRATVGALATSRGLRFAGPQNAPTRWWLYGFVRRRGDITIAAAKVLHHAMPTRVQFDGWFAKLKVTS